MPRFEPNVFQREELRVLLSSRSAAHNVSPIEWEKQHSATVEGKTLVKYDGELPLDDGCLKIRLLTPRLYQWHFVYVVRNVPVMRVCTNAKHKGLGKDRHTHFHSYQPETGEESCVLREDFPTQAMEVGLDVPKLQSAIQVFADECHIALSKGWWTSPEKTLSAAQ